jgi:hypothetical protein
MAKNNCYEIRRINVMYNNENKVGGGRRRGRRENGGVGGGIMNNMNFHI